MARTYLYLKVELDHDADELADRLAKEVCRQVKKLYGVRAVEISSLVPRGDDAS